MRELKIFSGRANQDLAKKICRHLHLDPAAITLGKFPDGENYCKLDEDVRGRDVFLVQPLSLIHISEPTRPFTLSRMPSSA